MDSLPFALTTILQTFPPLRRAEVLTNYGYLLTGLLSGEVKAGKVEQEIAESCRRLIKNAIIWWNSLFLSQKIAEACAPQCRQRLSEAVRTGPWPVGNTATCTANRISRTKQIQDSVEVRGREHLALELV